MVGAPLLLAAAMEAPVRRRPDGQPMLGPDGKPIIDEDAADEAVWDAYYANHQAAGNFKHLKVLDPFMGGGTTLVEGSRLGFQVAGVLSRIRPLVTSRSNWAKLSSVFNVSRPVEVAVLNC